MLNSWGRVQGVKCVHYSAVA